MRSMKKLVSVGLIFMFILASFLPALAENEKPYTYTVTISSGMRGTFNEYSLDSIYVDGKSDQDVVKSINEENTVITISNLEYGDRLIVDFANREEKNPVSVKQAKYYNKGIRKSGRDNDEASVNPSITVKGDEDYVVAYGIAGNMVAYTVYYVHAQTQENLLEPQIYYGNIGEKPVVPYQYIEGFLPQAYNLTKTLKDNAEVNVFEFDYTAIPSAETEIITNTVFVEIPQEEFTEDEGTVIVPPVINEAEKENQPEIDPNVPNQPQQPEEIIDIDDEETPLVKKEESQKELSGLDLSRFLSENSWQIGLGSLILILILIFVIMKKKSKQTEEQE